MKSKWLTGRRISFQLVRSHLPLTRSDDLEGHLPSGAPYGEIVVVSNLWSEVSRDSHTEPVLSGPGHGGLAFGEQTHELRTSNFELNPRPELYSSTDLTRATQSRFDSAGGSPIETDSAPVT